MSPTSIMFIAGYALLMLSFAFVARPYKAIHPF